MTASLISSVEVACVKTTDLESPRCEDFGTSKVQYNPSKQHYISGVQNQILKLWRLPPKGHKANQIK